MKIEKCSLALAHAWYPSLFLDYIKGLPSLAPFYGHRPLLKNMAMQIADKQSFSLEQRKVLGAVLRRQYKGFVLSPAMSQHLKKLEDKRTFTLCTGHQLSLCTGPLYVMFKLLTIIRMAKVLQQTYPSYHFIPIFWMHTEDHDKAEIDHLHLFSEKYTWETAQEGPVGRFSTEGIAKFLSTLPACLPVFKEAFTRHKTLSGAVRYYIHALFGEEGLLVLDPDEKVLKARFVSIMQKDIAKGVAYDCLHANQEALRKAGYRPVLKPRRVNLFYHGEGIRDRIDAQGKDFLVRGEGSLRFSLPALEAKIAAAPEQFSPNVVLRPLFQECILPNIAYIGGPTEIAYWLQLKGLFTHHGIPFPMLMPRIMGAVCPPLMQKRLRTFGLAPEALFWTSRARKQHVLSLKHPWHLNGEKARIEALMQEVQKKAAGIDPTLRAYCSKQTKAIERRLMAVEEKVTKALIRKEKDRFSTLAHLESYFFPNHQLQERHENFMTFQLNDPGFLSTLLEHIDPFDVSFSFLFLDENTSSD